MATKSISELTSAVAVDNGTLLEVATPDAGSASGYTSEKVSVAQLADHTANTVIYPTLQTTAKTLVGAINEAAQGGGGGGSSTLAGLTDVDISNPTNGQTLVYNATSGKWENGSGGANYSTTEHVVGTWIDGKTLYEKTFLWTWADVQSGSASGGRTQGEFDTTFGDEIDMIWIDFGNSYIKFTGTNADNASIVSQPLTYATAGGGYTRINIQRKPSMNNNKMFCWFDATYPTDIAADTSKWKWVVTFRYTKVSS